MLRLLLNLSLNRVPSCSLGRQTFSQFYREGWKRLWRHLTSGEELGKDVEGAGLGVEKELIVEMVTTALSMFEDVMGLRAPPGVAILQAAGCSCPKHLYRILLCG